MPPTPWGCLSMLVPTLGRVRAVDDRFRKQQSVFLLSLVVFAILFVLGRGFRASFKFFDRWISKVAPRRIALAMGALLALVVALLVVPVLVLLGPRLGHPLDLSFNIYELVAVITAVVVPSSALTRASTSSTTFPVA